MNAPQLRRASFRGVPFEVTSSNLSIGRRTQTFEYPQRDDPFTEDMGRSKRTIRITAFVVGYDYIDPSQGWIRRPLPGFSQAAINRFIRAM